MEEKVLNAEEVVVDFDSKKKMAAASHVDRTKEKEELKAELEIPTAFTIPIGDGIAINQTVVITWCIIAFLFVFFLVITRGFVTQNPGKRQALV